MREHNYDDWMKPRQSRDLPIEKLYKTMERMWGKDITEEKMKELGYEINENRNCN